MFMFPFLTSPDHQFTGAPHGQAAPHAAPPAPTAPGQPAPAAPTAGQQALDYMHGFAQEGLAGLLDPQGMRDRQAAQRELAGNFQIIDPHHRPRHPGQNQVTEAQFEQIARLYSDIRMGRTDFHFNTPDLNAADSAQYQRDMMAQMGRILETRSGRRLIGDLAHNRNHRDINLGTYRDSAGALDTTNASSEPQDQINAHHRKKGSDVDLSINPGVDDYEISSHASDRWHHARGDVVLYHEMSHAWNQVRGTEDDTGHVRRGEHGLNGSTRDERHGDVMRWEHQAVGLGRHRHDSEPNENHYRNERRAIGRQGGAGVVAGDDHMALRQSYD